MDFTFFSSKVNQTFQFAPDNAGFSLELVECNALPAHPTALPRTRDPFSLIFRGPANPVLPQRTYSLRTTGQSEPMEIFLVPVGRDASGVLYEAVFN